MIKSPHKSKKVSIIKYIYFNNKLPLSFLFGILFVILISSYTLFDNTTEVEGILEDFRKSKIDEIGVTFESGYNEIIVNNDVFIASFLKEIGKFEWEVMQENIFIDYDGQVFTFDIEGDTHIDEIKLLGKQYILITVIDSEKGSFKEISLKTTWNDDAYFRIVQLIDSITMDQP